MKLITVAKLSLGLRRRGPEDRQLSPITYYSLCPKFFAIVGFDEQIKVSVK
jgi:hypothetical protein